MDVDEDVLMSQLGVRRIHAKKIMRGIRGLKKAAGIETSVDKANKATKDILLKIISLVWEAKFTYYLGNTTFYKRFKTYKFKNAKCYLGGF